MSKSFSNHLVLGFVLTVSLWNVAIPALANRPTKTSPKITVRLYNYAYVQAEVLALAEEEATIIFGEAGVVALWLDCPLAMAEFDDYSACQQPPGPADLTLRILPRSMAERTPSGDNTFGFALASGPGNPGGIANVFYHRVEELARKGQCLEFQILGNVMAHEVGHLLLAPKAHSPAGIMKAKWNKQELQPAALASLRFTPQQADVIQNEAFNRVRQFEAARASGPVLSKQPGRSADSALQLPGRPHTSPRGDHQ